MSTSGQKRGLRVLKAALAIASLLGVTLTATPAAAQVSQPANTEPLSPYCHIYAIEGAEGRLQELRASCRGRGLMLGSATSYEAITNEALQATLVDVRLGTGRRVLLLSFQADGQPLVEDLSGQIALTAGRGPMSELAGVEIDVSGFAQSGAIGVRGRPEDNDGLAKSGQLNLGQQIALEGSREAEAITQN